MKRFFKKFNNTCHAELVSASYNYRGNKTLKQVQGDKTSFTLTAVGRHCHADKKSYRGKPSPLTPLPKVEGKKVAFTLAEVLITLGIIGVVAALTMPSLISNHRKHVVETKLKRVYSVMNQAINLAKVEYGDYSNWDDYTSCGRASNSCSVEQAINIFNKYIGKYIQYTKLEKSRRNQLPRVF